MKPPRRAGFSLLEVILATTILLGSAVVLAELASIGREHATSAEDLATAQLICQSKLNEILAGASPLTPVRERIVDDAPGWVYTVEIDPIDRPAWQQGLAALCVTVSEDLSGKPEPNGEGRRIRQFSLTHWIRDPNLDGRADSIRPSSAQDEFEQFLSGSEFR